LPGGTLFVSRKKDIFSWLKGAFDETGFRDITVISLDKDALAFEINSRNPRRIFMDSTFYTGVTPYMVGELMIRFPRLKIHIFNFSEFPDSLAVRFISHGAKSYIDCRDGPDEFRKALQAIYSGEDYYSPGVSRLIDELDEMPPLLKKEVSDRQWQVLFLACHGFTEEKIADALAISRRTVATHIEDLHEVLDVKKKEDLIRKAINLKWVNPTHLCFLGADLEIPPHPSKRKAGGNKKGKSRKAAG
jgi:DNA-binding NarL/FixJ family response regulator